MNEHIYRVKTFVDSHRVNLLVGVVSFGAGVGVGYFLPRLRRRQPDLHVLPQPVVFPETVATDLRNHISEEVVVEEDELVSLPESEEPLAIASPDDRISPVTRQFIEERLHRELNGQDEVVEPEVVEENRNVFANNGDATWNYEEEQKSRTILQPYILHKDEFYADEKEYDQITLNYYAGDNILTSDDNTPIYNHHDVVGELKFGHGSGDPNVVYIRNDKLKAEYEVIRDPGMYSVEVLGLEIEDNQRAKDLRHSGHQKFRMD